MIKHFNNVRPHRGSPISMVPRRPVQKSNPTLARLMRSAAVRHTSPLKAEEARLSLLANDRDLLREKMTGENLDYMPPWQEPAPGALHSDFETPKACEQEDAFRFKAAARGQHLALAGALAPRQGEPSANLASARFGRVWRMRVILAALRLFLRRRCYFLTVIPPGWWVPVKELQTLNPRTLMQVFKRQVARAGGGECGGILFVKLEASLEVHEVTGELGWQFHLHGVVTEEMRLVMSAVREVRAFGCLSGVKQPIRGKAICDENLSRVLGYSTKQKVNAGEFAVVEHEGMTYSLVPWGRLPEPFHSDYLRWLYRWRPADLCLTVGSKDMRHSLRASWY